MHTHIPGHESIVLLPLPCFNWVEGVYRKSLLRYTMDADQIALLDSAFVLGSARRIEVEQGVPLAIIL